MKVNIANYKCPPLFLLSLSVVSELMSCGMEYAILLLSLGQVLEFFHSQDLATSQLLMGKGMLERQCWCCVSSAQQEPKHWSVTSTFVTSSAEHSPARAVGNTNCISARPNTPTSLGWLQGHPSLCVSGIHISPYLLDLSIELGHNLFQSRPMLPLRLELSVVGAKTLQKMGVWN